MLYPCLANISVVRPPPECDPCKHDSTNTSHLSTHMECKHSGMASRHSAIIGYTGQLQEKRYSDLSRKMVWGHIGKDMKKVTDWTG